MKLSKKRVLSNIILFLTLTLVFSYNFMGHALSSNIIHKNVRIGIDTAHKPNHVLFDTFISNYTSTGNYATELDNLTNIDELHALLIPGSRLAYSNDELSTIKQWFQQGNKLLFVTADSDYGAYFQSDAALNPLLSYLNSSLRFDSGAVADSVHNDGMSYRVIATQPGDGTIGSKVNEGLNQILLHGPTTIFGIVDGQPVDLRNVTIPNVEILFSYSNESQILDQDVSERNSDFYFYHTTVQGNYPAVVVEKMGDSYLVLAGECLFTDYKYMFGIKGEHGTPIDNHYFTIRLLNYFYEKLWESELTATTKTTTTKKSPFSFLMPLLTLVVLSTLSIKIKKRLKG